MFSFSQETTDRIKAFDSIQSKTGAVLAHPNVIHLLGDWAAELTRVNDTMFLPNIREGVIKLPKDQREKDHAALLPILDSDPAHGLRYSAPMVLPGPKKRARLAEMIAAKGHEKDPTTISRITAEACQEFSISRAQATLDRYLGNIAKARQRGLFAESGTIWQAAILDEQQSAICGRQVVVTPAELAGFSSLAVGNIVAHEQRHIADNDNRDYETYFDDGYDDRKELRGYHVGYAICMAMIGDMQPHERVLVEHTLEVEALRVQSKAGTSEDPFATNAQIAAYFHPDTNRYPSSPDFV